MSDDHLLAVSTVGRYLASRGVASNPLACTAEVLAGGVSNIVIGADTGDRKVVVKQSLERLRVADDWLAPRQRVLTEAVALDLAWAGVPGSCPRVIDRDAERCVIVIERAPAAARDWRTVLLDGAASVDADVAVADVLGRRLAAWHSMDPPTDAMFTDQSAFTALRLDPYYRTAMGRRPEVAALIGEYAETLKRRRTSMVHGDFSPKNVLVVPSGVWVIDWEVAHVGDPAFDLAFLLSHLVLKTVHLPQSSDRFRSCADAFTCGYVASGTPSIVPDWQYVIGQVGCLLIARTDGKSPAGYLNTAATDVVRHVAVDVLRDPPASVGELWKRLFRMASSA